MVYSLGYKRPASTRSMAGISLNSDLKQTSIDESIASQHSSMSHGIPEELSFDHIVSGGTCPPCTLRNFHDYLKYIERSVENLQFYLWLRDYTKRFDQLPQREKKLSKKFEITPCDAEAISALARRRQPRKPDSNAVAAAIFKGTSFEADAPKVTECEKSNPFGDSPPLTPSLDSHTGTKSFDSSTDGGLTARSYTTQDNHAQVTEAAFEEAGHKCQPFTIQPYHEEIKRIVSIYVAEGAPRELNLSMRERDTVLYALNKTTHPSAFAEIARGVEWSLRCQSHPNFIRWSIANGNPARQKFAYGLSGSLILVGIVAIILLILSRAPQAYRAFAFAPLFFGFSILFAALKGLCVVLHGRHHRQIRPWELFATEDEPSIVMIRVSSDEESRNSWEDEPWVPMYKQRNIIRKIFDNSVWIEEPALRQIQDTIFVQSLAFSFILSAVIVGPLCAIPPSNLF
ncbi:hypothetical protein K490DRAFT_69913 [Saccharata proteae CBS 121410]|uniref:RGS domain-containing protein n=1 Tax=Saccharata proteae CBS 121410 TaxID=1314787 RepID=A0A9P4LTT0_9PEZI|nr:hypothetical protein K490DRAFT_69913 [Saccharata proteae CBS 121410]